MYCTPPNSKVNSNVKQSNTPNQKIMNRQRLGIGNRAQRNTESIGIKQRWLIIRQHLALATKKKGSPPIDSSV